MLTDLKWDLIETRRQTLRLTRRSNNMQFEVQHHTSTPYIQSFFPEAIALWNALPQSSVDMSSNATFKTSIQDHRLHSPR